MADNRILPDGISTPNQAYQSRIGQTFNSDRTSYASGETAQIMIDSQNLLDMSSHYLSMKVQAYLTAGADNKTAFFDPGFPKVIDSVQLYSYGDTLIEECTNQNILRKLLVYANTSNSWRDSYGRAQGLRKTAHDQSDMRMTFGGADATTATRQIPYGELTCIDELEDGTHCVFDLKGVMGIFSINKYLPGFVLGRLRLQINFSNVKTAVVRSTDAGCTMAITDLKLHLETVRPSDLLRATITKAVQAGSQSQDPTQRVSYSFDSWAVVTDQWGTATSKEVVLAKSASSLLSAYTVFLDGGVWTDSSTESLAFLGADKFTDGTTTVQYRHGSDLYPSQPVKTKTQAFMELQKAFHQNHDINSHCSYKRFSDTFADASGWHTNADGNTTTTDQVGGCFVLATELEVDPTDAVSGLNTMGGSNLSISVNQMGALGANTKMYCFLHYRRVLQLNDQYGNLSIIG